MKREYFGMLVILVVVILLIGADYIFETIKVREYLNKYIVVWVLIVYQLGQFSMRFPKHF